VSSGLSTSHTSVRRLADALMTGGEERAAASPRVRGADWRQAVVASVLTDGTVTTTDGITARRMDSYQYPAAGDLIIISISSSGSWIAAGRLAPATGTGWQLPTLLSPWVDYGGAYQRVRYRRQGGEAVIEGVVKTTATVSGTVTIFTLPAGYRPPLNLVTAQMTGGDTARQVNVRDTGAVDAMSLPAGSLSFLSLNLRFALS